MVERIPPRIKALPWAGVARATFVALMISLPPALWGQPRIEKTLDISSTEQTQSLNFLQGTDVNLRFALQSNGRKYKQINNYTSKFYYATALTNSAFVTVNSTAMNRSRGTVDFALDASDTNTNGTFVAVMQLIDTSANVYWFGTMDLTITKSTIIDYCCTITYT